MLMISVQLRHCSIEGQKQRTADFAIVVDHLAPTQFLIHHPTQNVVPDKISRLAYYGRYVIDPAAESEWSATRVDESLIISGTAL